MTDIFLRFPDEATSLPLLYEGEGEDKRPRFRALDVLGVIYEQLTPPQDPEAAWPEPVALPGWHVNIRPYPDEDVSALLPFEVHPLTPRRTFGPLEPPPGVEPYVIPPPQPDPPPEDGLE